MTRKNLLVAFSVASFGMWLLIHPGQTAAQDQTPPMKHGPGFVDKNGDGYNDYAPDHDGDGIPNGVDPDYTGPRLRGGRGMAGFVDADGDGINDRMQDWDGDGIANCQDPDWQGPIGIGPRGRGGRGTGLHRFGRMRGARSAWGPGWGARVTSQAAPGSQTKQIPAR